jgi:hypothetical protein
MWLSHILHVVTKLEIVLWISLCGSWTCTSLDTRFVRRDTHLLTTVGNIRWEGGGGVSRSTADTRQNFTVPHGQ